MAEIDWHKCKFLESAENLKPLVKKRFGREPSSSIAREMAACLLQGRLFYEAAASSPLEIRPLQQFYGMVGFAKAIVIAKDVRSLATLRHANGLLDISDNNSRIADLRVRIQNAGTFQEFNDAIASFTRLCYIDNQTNYKSILLPSASSNELCGLVFSLKDIVGRVPTLESLYRMTFGESSQTDVIGLETGARDHDFRIRIDDPEPFTDRASLKNIVDRWRSRFPFLASWRLTSAQRGWGNSIIYFRNVANQNIDEYSETYLMHNDGVFQEAAVAGDENRPFSLEEGFRSVAGGYTGGTVHAISPISGFYISEFSIHYLCLFLLSSLVRYRPQTWTHAISRSAVAGASADDKALSLIERFLDINTSTVPEMVVQVLNPFEDPFA